LIAGTLLGKGWGNARHDPFDDAGHEKLGPKDQEEDTSDEEGRETNGSVKLRVVHSRQVGANEPLAFLSHGRAPWGAGVSAMAPSELCSDPTESKEGLGPSFHHGTSEPDGALSLSRYRNGGCRRIGRFIETRSAPRVNDFLLTNGGDSSGVNQPHAEWITTGSME
jgi:hypothetical protein